MKELRDIKLDLLMCNQNPIVNLFNQITKDLKIINCNVYNEEGLEFIYYQPSTNEWIFYQDSKNEKFWCSYKRYWSLFESNLRLEYKEIQAITKYLVEETLKREVDTPLFLANDNQKMVEEALKREVTTPFTSEGPEEIQVEDALKREVGTPTGGTPYSWSEVGKALKRNLENKM